MGDFGGLAERAPCKQIPRLLFWGPAPSCRWPPGVLPHVLLFRRGYLPVALGPGWTGNQCVRLWSSSVSPARSAHTHTA